MPLPIITIIIIIVVVIINLFQYYFVEMSPYSRILTQELLNDLHFMGVPPKIIVGFCLTLVAHEAVLEITQIRLHHLTVKVDFLACLDEFNGMGVVEQPMHSGALKIALFEQNLF